MKDTIEVDHRMIRYNWERNTEMKQSNRQKYENRTDTQLNGAKARINVDIWRVFFQTGQSATKVLNFFSALLAYSSSIKITDARRLVYEVGS